jgi:hypothetical protein
MSTANAAYESLTTALAVQDNNVASSQMFGKPCLKVGGKAFVALHNDMVVFKLTGTQHEKALALSGALLWDPSGKGRPMKEWVALPATHTQHFKSLAGAALAYVSAG